MTILFIRSLIEGDWTTLFMKFGFQALAWVLVLIACLIDLRTGLKASKANGVFRTSSFGLRQTLKKFKDYMDVLLMAFICDLFLSIFVVIADDFSFLKIFSLPLVTIVVFIYTMATEFISVLENKRKARGRPIYTLEAIDAINDLSQLIGVDGVEKLAKMVKRKTTEKQATDEHKN